MLFVRGSPMKSLHPSGEVTVSMTPYGWQLFFFFAARAFVRAQLLLTEIT